MWFIYNESYYNYNNWPKEPISLAGIENSINNSNINMQNIVLVLFMSYKLRVAFLILRSIDFFSNTLLIIISILYKIAQ